MGKCLVTKLKEVVNNDNLSYFNTVVISVNADTQSDDLLRFQPSPVSGKSIEVELMDASKVMYHTDNTFTKVYGNSATIVGTPGVTDDNKNIVDVSEGSYKIHIRKADNIAILAIGGGMSVNLEDLKYSLGLIGLTARTGVLHCIGDISCLSNCIAATDLQLGSSDCYGDITVLAKCINLARLNVNTSLIDSENHSLHDFALAMVQVGHRDSGALEVVTNANLGGGGNRFTITFYPVSEEHPLGYTIS